MNDRMHLDGSQDADIRDPSEFLGTCPLSMADILACAVPVFKTNDDTRDCEKERSYRIVMFSSIQTIWNARCERVIQQILRTTTDTKQMKKINKRLEMYCLMTCQGFDRKALQKDLVIRTW
ncbi:hypothetical protein IW262DRAFT_497642 [Armillaria fumosa]|nr:hypothetical protein IW262DRAFT_497642 [Armillaria fumosa]